MSYIYSTAFNSVAHGCCLYYGVLLCVESHAQFMPLSGRHVKLLAQTASPFFAMHYSSGRPVISCRYGMSVFYYNRAYLTPHTSGPLCCKFSHLHKIFVPGRSFHNISPIHNKLRLNTSPGPALYGLPGFCFLLL